jgi:transposase
VKAIEAGYLGAGDYLICDNARIHGAADTFEILTGILNMAGVELVYLPPYSPELNPIELVFMQVKRHLREYRDMTIPLWADIAFAFGMISHSQVLKYFERCLKF